MIATGNQGYSRNGNNAQTAGGYVDLGISTGRDITVQPTEGSYLANRLNQVNEAYNETIRRTDAEFASMDRVSSVAEPAEVHSFRMTCECLEQSSIMDLVEHVLKVRQGTKSNDLSDSRFSDNQFSDNQISYNAESQPILIHVADYQEAIELDRRLAAFGVKSYLSSPFSNWTAVLGKLGTGQIDVIISTTIEIPHVDQIAWKAIYLPSAMHLAMLTTPAMDWLGNYWFANNLDEQPPRLIVRRQRS